MTRWWALAATGTLGYVLVLWLVLPVIALLAAVMGAAWALIASGLDRWRGVPVVLSTILLNFIAVAVVGMLVQGPLHDPATTAPQTALIADHLRLPALVDGTKLHLGVVLAFVIALVLWLGLTRTTIGFEVQVVGLNPVAARQVGMPVAARQILVMALSGGLAGVAGAAQVLGVTGMLSGSPVSYGYAGIAVAMLGRLHPLGIIAAALFLGMLSTGARHLERRLAIPHDVGDVVQGLLVLAVLVAAAIAAFLDRYAEDADAAVTVSFSLARSGDSAAITVRDNGAPIEKDEFARKTRPLDKLDHYLSANGSSMSMALRTVARAAQLAGGELTHATENGGNAFRLTFSDFAAVAGEGVAAA